jgi:pantoate kinase
VRSPAVCVCVLGRQEALKELQDPAVQQQVRQMLEDPTFQQSMKEYMQQITKDPQFEALKKQTEAMLQEEGFVDQMTKAFSELGSALGTGEAGEANEK